MSQALEKAASLIKEAKSIVLITHVNPDGDAIGSILALHMALKSINKNSIAFCKDPVPPVFNFLPTSSSIKDTFPANLYDLYITIDCGDLKRTGVANELVGLKDKRVIVNMDHHLKNDLHKIANLNIVDTGVAATAELIALLIDQLKVKLTPEIATCMLTAIYTDTGGFKHSNTSIETLQLASRLLAAGARLQKISDHINNKKTITSLKLWGTVLSRLNIHSTFKVATSFITYDDLQKSNATMQNLEGVVNFMGGVPGTKAAILLTEIEKGVIKGSLRTESDKVDVAKIAKVFGGGGHKKASGFIIPGKLFKDSHGWRIIPA